MSAPHESHLPPAQVPWVAERGAKLRITAVRTFLTAPQGCPYLIVRIETNDPGLYGLGCAGDPQRTLAVRGVIDDYLAPLLRGRDPGDIEDLHRLALNSAYWRGGSITGNALGGLTPARKLAAACDLHGVRLAPHGPGDVSPFAQAATSPSPPPALPSESRRRRPSARRFWRSSPERSCRAWARWSPGRPRGWASTSTRAPRAGIPPPEPLAHDRWALLRTTEGSVRRP
ncbi:hypothetical protein [Streptomyces sp. PSAA01]|uniref:hypothetical protein n=1 Tax=Streptomyces sp. PSAA01 TaxID=2912762 RepID=UPI001F429682|nr:hypothetical protein [Streptomyces sp. PSAA01]MCG0285837.1 hypothetical protein [Streptomyces sp. PSAA01]